MADEAAMGVGKDEAEGERETSPDLQASEACEPSGTEEDGGCTASPVGEGQGAEEGSSVAIQTGGAAREVEVRLSRRVIRRPVKWDTYH